MIKQLSVFTSEVTRVAREVGTEAARRSGAGQRGGRVWKDDRERQPDGQQLHGPGAQHRRGDIAVASGDLSKKITVDVRGEILQLKEAINTMVDQLRSFAAEVTRVAREVGTEGKLGGQAVVPGVAGTWKDLTESVNAWRPTSRPGAKHRQVTTAVARGDCREDHRRREGRDPRAEGHDQHHGGPAQRVCLGGDARGARGRHRRRSAVRRRCPAWPGHGRT